MRRLYLLVIFTFISYLLFSQESVLDSTRDEIIRDFQRTLITDEITASNEVLIFQNGKIVFRNTVNSEKKGDKPISKETIFPIWSMTKVITNVAMLILHEKGLISFEDPLSKYLPAFSEMQCMKKNDLKSQENESYCRQSNPTYKCKNELKIIHLMAHRSGICTPDNFYLNAIKSKNLKELINQVATIPLHYEPGTKYLYGINQSVLGRVIEVISQRTFNQFLKEFIFDPIEMYNTKFYVTDEERKLFQPLYIKNENIKGFSTDGFSSFGDIMLYEDGNKTPLGAEGLVSTTDDFSKFCLMLLNNGNYNGKQIIKPESIDLITSKFSEGYPIEDRAIRNLDGFYNGLSVFVLEDPEAMNLGATKGIYGWGGAHSTEFWIDPKKNLFAIFMTRARTNFEQRERFMKAVYSVY